MGEYATYKGQQIKIGTCENLTDLRAEHATWVSPSPTSPDALASYRFRFPWPEEDGKEPGTYGRPDYEKSMNVPGAPAADLSMVEHGMVFLSDSRTDSRLRVGFPCPLGPRGKAIAEAAELKFWDTGRGVNIAMQRAWGGRLVLCAKCPACDHMWRYPTLEDVAGVLDALEQQAKAYRFDASHAANRADMWRNEGNKLRAEAETNDARDWLKRAVYFDTVAERIRAGYTDPPAFVVAAAAAESLV